MADNLLLQSDLTDELLLQSDAADILLLAEDAGPTPEDNIIVVTIIMA